jgi:hypothetical protein
VKTLEVGGGRCWGESRITLQSPIQNRDTSLSTVAQNDTTYTP